MKFHEPEVVEMGLAGELIEITVLQNTKENPPDPEPTFNSGAIYIFEDE